ncbi:hypothetical protein AMAG_19802 [Allomyces macrogynus ATCC 38327]|uniref:Uncharacterized protein n=1 Tax=Allomyces macrogynus (strain ATCC 38327) TaxID=578462 RepID=A0A0L0T0Z4_ALLM3|nr:hypothetical protein AMAG_19802 [Allomyces macrogynus ATCC 38327]|eukprot:KNE68422.1 hypothetical protein AMAG_19802 [Allomyces macrogynus ATCC 38327]
MAQGTLKKVKVGASLTKHHRKPEKTKVGKTTGLNKNAALQKKLKGQTIADIERIMATRAAAVGKLTIMKSVAEPKTNPKDKKERKGKKAAAAKK